jgi:predicted nucleotidyltransferase
VAKVQNEKGTVMTRADIVRILGTKKQELLEVHGVTQIGLFGSYARQSAGDDSDIDIMVEIEDDKKTLTPIFAKHLSITPRHTPTKRACHNIQ